MYGGWSVILLLSDIGFARRFPGCSGARFPSSNRRS